MSQSKGKNEELTFDYIVIGTGPSGAVIASLFRMIKNLLFLC